MLMNNPNLEGVKASEIMTANPKSIADTALVAEALELMRSCNITQLPVLSGADYVGVIHLHDILKEGIL